MVSLTFPLARSTSTNFQNSLELQERSYIRSKEAREGTMRELGKLLFFLGLFLATVGAGILIGTRTGGLPFRLGRLPGDIAYHSQNSTVYFPIVTCLVLSAFFTVVMWLVSLFRH